MLDIAAQTRIALAWSDLTAGFMRQAMAASVANMNTMTGMLGTAAPEQDGPSWRRDPRSTAMPWYRAPEQRAYNNAFWWLEPAMPSPAHSMMNPFALWQVPGPHTGWGLDVWQTPLPAARGASAAVPGLLALVAMGMAAQQGLALIEATQGWQAAGHSSRYGAPLPNYRSDSGHAVANIVMGSPMAAATLPLTGLALVLQMFGSMQPRSSVTRG